MPPGCRGYVLERESVDRPVLEHLRTALLLSPEVAREWETARRASGDLPKAYLNDSEKEALH